MLPGFVFMKNAGRSEKRAQRWFFAERARFHRQRRLLILAGKDKSPEDNGKGKTERFRAFLAYGTNIQPKETDFAGK